MPKSIRNLMHSAATLLVTVSLTTAAQAAGSGMPWEAPLQKILDSVQGPVGLAPVKRFP